MPHAAIIFARPEESRVFRRRLGLSRAGGRIGSITAAIFHSGIGPDAAHATAGRVLGRGGWWMVVSAGFAGALDPRLAHGDIIIAELPAPARLISRPLPVATPAEKAALHRETGAQAVDMESEAIASACAAAGVPALAVRAISDTARCELPVPFTTWYDPARQRPRPFALAAHLLAHPRKIGPFLRFVRALPGAALAVALESALRSLENH